MILDDLTIRCVGIKRGEDYPDNWRAWRYLWERLSGEAWEPWSEDYSLGDYLASEVYQLQNMGGEDCLIGQEFVACWNPTLGKYRVGRVCQTSRGSTESSRNHWEHDRPHENDSDPLKTPKFYA